jgi:hypothetical protein
MFDPSGMYPNGFHPVKIDKKRNFKGKATSYTRTQRPPRYILIDFGLSRQYSTRDVVDEPLRGGDKTAPEHRIQRSSNPFYTDIYYIGNLVREKFVMVRVHIGRFYIHCNLTYSLIEISGLPIHGRLGCCHD